MSACSLCNLCSSVVDRARGVEKWPVLANSRFATGTESTADSSTRILYDAVTLLPFLNIEDRNRLPAVISFLLLGIQSSGIRRWFAGCVDLRESAETIFNSRADILFCGRQIEFLSILEAKIFEIDRLPSPPLLCHLSVCSKRELTYVRRFQFRVVYAVDVAVVDGRHISARVGFLTNLHDRCPLRILRNRLCTDVSWTCANSSTRNFEWNMHIVYRNLWSVDCYLSCLFQNRRLQSLAGRTCTFTREVQSTYPVWCRKPSDSPSSSFGTTTAR